MAAAGRNSSPPGISVVGWHPRGTGVQFGFSFELRNSQEIYVELAADRRPL